MSDQVYVQYVCNLAIYQNVWPEMLQFYLTMGFNVMNIEESEESDDGDPLARLDPVLLSSDEEAGSIPNSPK